VTYVEFSGKDEIRTVLGWRLLTDAASARTFGEDIAAALGLSVHTTNQYLAATTHKLNAMSRTHAVAKALRLGLIA
jgi:FixJ family two-component response regulator